MADILGIGVSGLNAFQSLLSTTSHNISNGATEGYNRQVTELLTQTPQFVGGALVGSGVKVGATLRVTDEVLSSVNRNNLTSEAQYEAEESFASQINQLVADSSTGVSEVLNRFFSSLDELSTQTPSVQHRQVVLSESESLITRVNTLDNRFNEINNDLENQLRETVSSINSIAASIAKVNADILNSANIGAFSEPNDLKDLRDKLLTDLAKLVQVFTFEKDDETIDVFIGNGQTLIVGGSQTTLGTQRDASDVSKLDIVSLTTGSSASNVITDVLVGGKIGGLKNFRDNTLSPARAQLGRMVMSLGLTFNAQHKLGLDANSELGGDFFNDFNTLSLRLARSLPNTRNLGSAIFSVAIDEIPRPTNGPYTVFGTPSTLVNQGSLAQLNAGELTINGFAIRATTAADDTVSSEDKANSAIAVAAAINDSTSGTGVTAAADINALYLGTVTVGALGTGDFLINGTEVTSAGGSVAQMLRDINRHTATTGVRAEEITTGTITLFADDGRNIQLQTDGGGTGRFQHFDTSGGGGLNQIQRAGIRLNHIDSAIVIAGNAPADVGLTAGTTPAPATSLTDSDYELRFDGTNYTLTRSDDGVVVATTTDPAAIAADGFTIALNNGTASAGDTFIIRPTIAASQNFALNIKRTDKLAMGSVIRTLKDDTNAGTGEILAGRVLNTSGIPLPLGNVLGNAFATANTLTPPIKVVFEQDSNGDAVKYRVFDNRDPANPVQIGPLQTFVPNTDNDIFPIPGVTDDTSPGPNAPYVYDPGYRITISGAPKDGDSFTVAYNDRARSDGSNAKQMLALRNENLLSNNTVTLQGAYAELVTSIGATTQTVDINLSAAVSLRRESEARIQSISGVNMDEEATNLIRYQQSYRANAQVIAIGGTLFDAIIDAVRR